MSIIAKAGKTVRKLIKKASAYNIKRIQKNKIKELRRAAVINGVILTKEQESQIQSLYSQNLGCEISTDWHRYYQGVSGTFAADYVPELHYALYECAVNSSKYINAYTDKILQYQILSSIPEIKTAELYLFNRSGVWYDANFAALELKEAIETIRSKQVVFYKPINDTNSGIGCGIFGADKKSDDEIKEFLSAHNNYMIQSIVKNADDVAQFHPASCNTFRIMTYKHEGKVYDAPALLRMGVGHQNVDNAHAGGIFVGVGRDGSLKSVAHSEYGEDYIEHPTTKVAFGGKKIKKVPELIEALKKAHNHFQHMGILSWDAVIDTEGNFVVIEVNSLGQSPWLVQMANGTGLFEENTPKVLQEMKNLFK